MANNFVNFLAGALPKTQQVMSEVKRQEYQDLKKQREEEAYNLLQDQIKTNENFINQAYDEAMKDPSLEPYRTEIETYLKPSLWNNSEESREAYLGRLAEIKKKAKTEGRTAKISEQIEGLRVGAETKAEKPMTDLGVSGIQKPSAELEAMAKAREFTGGERPLTQKEAYGALREMKATEKEATGASKAFKKEPTYGEETARIRAYLSEKKGEKRSEEKKRSDMFRLLSAYRNVKNKTDDPAERKKYENMIQAAYELMPFYMAGEMPLDQLAIDVPKEAERINKLNKDQKAKEIIKIYNKAKEDKNILDSLLSLVGWGKTPEDVLKGQMSIRGEFQGMSTKEFLNKYGKGKTKKPKAPSKKTGTTGKEITTKSGTYTVEPM